MNKTNDNEIEKIISWVESPEEVLYWAGPNVNFPMSIKSFRNEILSANVHSHLEYDGGQLIGFGQVLNTDTRKPTLGRIIIDPLRRSRGHGNKLLEALIKYCITKLSGIEGIYLNVFPDNQPAISLYRKYGFEEIGLEKNARELNGKKYDLLQMKKDCRPQDHEAKVK